MQRPRMLFVRRWGGVNGGQIKVFDYARHVRDSDLFAPWLYLTPESTPLDASLDFAGLSRAASPDDADAFFLAGFDWRVLDDARVVVGRRPVVNLIQGFTHVTPGNEKHDFLSRPALRVCVSGAVADAIRETGRTNGPVVTIENGLAFPPPSRARDSSSGVLIAGAKNAPMAHDLAAALESKGIVARVLTEIVERGAFLDALAGARIALLLPHDREGFFLPALEAMARDCAVVVPDCLGTRSFCIDEVSALVCDYSVEAMTGAVLRLIDHPSLVENLVDGGRARASIHSLTNERAQFAQALRTYVDSGAYLS